MKSRQKPAKLYELIGIEDDEKTEEEDFSFMPVGYGVQDIPGIINAAEKAGAKWLLLSRTDPQRITLRSSPQN